MSVHDDVVEFRMRVVRVIEASPNRRAACRAAGIHPSTFYRWRNQPQPQRRVRSLQDRWLESQVVARALASPKTGPRLLASRMTREGIAVSGSRVWRILRGHRLNTRALRDALLSQHRAEPSIQVSPRAPAYVGRLDASVPGDLVQMDCFHVGSFKETRLRAGKQQRGQIWQYTAVDVASSWLWAELHATPHNPSPAITSALAHRVAADLRSWGWEWKTCSTDNGNEYRAATFGGTLAELGVTHRFIKAGRPQSNGKAEGIQGYLIKDFYQPALIGYTQPSITGLRRDLDTYLADYNWQRPHNGRWNQGQTPADIMIPNPKLHP